VSSASNENRFDQRYLIVFGASLVQFTIIGLLFSFGLFFKAFEAEFGWSRTLLSTCTSFSFLVMGVLAVFGGRLSDHYGPRLVLAITGILGGLGYILLSQVTQPWQLFVYFGLLLGIGMSTHDVVTLSIVARWFHKRRGIMTAVVKVGTAVGQFTIPPVVAFLMVRYDWRSALIIMGIIAIALLLIAASLTRNPDGKQSSGLPVITAGINFAQARRSKIFWLFCSIQFLFFPPLITIPLHIVVHGMDLGMTAVLAATLLSVMAAASVMGRLTIGLFFDRIGGKRALILCFIPLIASLVAFLFIVKPWLLFVAVAVYGFAHGGFFTVMSPTIAEYFGLKAHGTLFGFIVFFGTIGGAVGPIFAGSIFDSTGSYFWAFCTLAVMVFLGLLLTLLLPSPDTDNQHGSI